MSWITEDASLQRKRLQREERAARFRANPRKREIGVDVDVLAAQVKQKEARTQAEREAELTWGNNAIHDDHQMQRIQLTADNERRNRARDDEEYDRLMLKEKGRQAIAAVKQQHEDDPFASHGATQRGLVFAGEEPHYRDRKRAMAAQQAAWTKQQLDDKERARLREAEQQQQRDFSDTNMTNLATKISQAATDVRAAATTDVAAYNKKAAQQKRDAAEARQWQNEIDRQTEVWTQMNSDFLSERAGASSQPVPGYRGVADVSAFKGFTPSQRHAFLAGQEKQRTEQQQRRQAQADHEEELYIAQLNTNRAAAALERQRAREKRAQGRQLASTWGKQATEARSHKAELDATYANKIDEAFFDQYDQCY